MASIGSIVAQLRQAVDHLHQALTHVRGARDTAQEGRQVAETLGARGVVARFQAIADRAEELERMLLAGVEAGERLIAQAEAIRHGGGTAGGGAPAAPVVGGGTASAPDPPSPDPPLGMPILAGPDGLRRVLNALPTRPNDEGPTTGQLFRPGGRPVANGKLRSFRDRSLMADLELGRKGRRSEAMASHVEAKAAKMMRDGKAPQHSTLLINNVDGPCGWLARQQGEPRVGTSCDELLSDALPADSSLTVRWRDRGGVERSQVYRGTGRSIRR